MEITSIGQQGYSAAQQRLAAQAKKIVKNGPEVEDVVELKLAEKQAEISAKIIKTGIEVEDALLDILA